MIAASQIGAEAKLLLTCATLELTQGQREMMNGLLLGPLDWAAVLDLAASHGLRPLLQRHLEGLEEWVPKAVIAELWSRQQRLARRNRVMLSELLAVLGALESVKIIAIPYKGPMLALAAYGELQLREFGDLDLLVRPRDVPGARALLATLGYEPKYSITPAAEAAMLASRMAYDLAFNRRDPQVLVELHWKTDPEFPVEQIALDSWWARLDSVRIEHQTVLCLEASEYVLVLCLHGSKHLWLSIGWLVDVAELIKRTPGLDWSRILVRAKELKASTRLALGLSLLQSLLHVPLPEFVSIWLAGQQRAQHLAAWIVPRILDPEARPLTAFERLRANFALYETLSQRAQHVVDVVISPGINEWTRYALPRPLHFLYPPLRWSRLVMKHARR